MRGVEKKGGKGGRRAEGWGEVEEGAGGRKVKRRKGGKNKERVSGGSKEGGREERREGWSE